MTKGPSSLRDVVLILFFFLQFFGIRKLSENKVTFF